MCTTSFLFIYLSMNICFHVLTIINSAAVNIGMCISFQIFCFVQSFVLFRVEFCFVQSFVQIYAQEWDCWIIRQLLFLAF